MFQMAFAESGPGSGALIHPMMRYLPFVATACSIGFSVGFVMPRHDSGPRSQGASVGEYTEPEHRAVTRIDEDLSELDFTGLSRERQCEVLVRMAEKLEHSPSQADILLTAKALAGLSFEQGVELLGDLRSSEAFQALRAGGDDCVRQLLIERIAAANPEAALEYAQKRDLRILLGASLDAIAQRSAAEALRAISRLSGRHQIMGIWFVRGLSSGEFSMGPQSLGGTLDEAVAALKTNPGLFLQSQFGAQLRGLLATLASKDTEDPAAAVFKLRAAMRELFRAQPGVDARKADALVAQRIGDVAASMQFPNTADVHFGIFNALKENERGDAVAGRVVGRLARESGVEAAMRFAEERRADGVPKELALRAFLAISREDPRAAMRWIESLPAGPLRQGVLLAVAYAAIADATLVDPDAGHADALTDGGMRLFSDKTKTDYFVMLISGDSGIAGSMSRSSRSGSVLLDVPRSVFIEDLPIPEVEKVELWKLTAPIRAK